MKTNLTQLYLHFTFKESNYFLNYLATSMRTLISVVLQVVFFPLRNIVFTKVNSEYFADYRPQNNWAFIAD